MPTSRRKFITTGLLATTGLVLADAFWFEKFFIEVNHIYIDSAAKNSSSIKIVQVSDLHLRSINYQLEQLTKSLNKLKPDLILFTGDSIDKRENIELLNHFLQLLDKDIKKAAILGNWEYWGNVDLGELKRIYKENNCTLLINQTTQFALRDTTISITGVDDFIGGSANITAATAGYSKSDHHIILNHCPQYTDHISTQINKDIKVDLILSEHTHGGQFNILGFTPFLPQGSGKYVKGWYRVNGIKMFVSKGVGTSIFPARLGARAEVTVFHLS
jgi:hypothetical protein